MRCYFIRNGHIVGFEEIIGLTDEEAILRGYALFEARTDNIDAFEIWELDRFVFTSQASGERKADG
jgi:hypothetical protein